MNSKDNIEGHEATESGNAVSLVQRIIRVVNRATENKIEALQVTIEGSNVVLCGKSGTFYATKLAEHATAALVEKDQQVVNRIEVW